MSITAGTALLIASLIAGAAGTVGQMGYNAIQANKNREFQRDMRDTSLISTVEQANKLGISPSLVLGQQSGFTGGSSASVGSPNYTPLSEIMSYIKQDRYLDAMERINQKQPQMKSGTGQEKKSYDYLFNNLNDFHP